MNEHRFILQPYKGMCTRFKCPGCNSTKKTFVRYIDTTTGEQIAAHVGKCNRESNCNYHYTPKQYFQDNNISFDSVHVHAVHTAYTVNTMKEMNTVNGVNTVNSVNESKPSFIEPNIFKSSLKGYEENVFIKQLLKRFGTDIIKKVIEKYFIGTSKRWPGSTIFWQIDISGKIRTGKIMLYDDNLHRVKNPYDKIDWVHNVLKIENFNLKQSLFGEHLLKGNTKSVAIVESEKTAIIASIYLPQFIWLSCGNLQGLNIEKLNVLQGRKVCLFPDLNAYEKWSEKAKEFEKKMPGTSFKVSDLLERKATKAEKEKGLDIADFDIKEFQKEEKPLEPISILIDNILSIPTETITGNDFENLNIVWIKTNHGNYDVLFDKEGEPVQEFTNTVKKLSIFFEKDFKPALLNGQKCLAHINN